MSSKNRHILPKRVSILLTHALAAGVFLLWVFIIGCPLHRFTGIPCPGCGMSRALIAVFRLDFSAAWYYHPLVFFVPLPIMYLIHRNAWRLPGGKRFVSLITFALVIALVSVYIWRFHLPDSVVRSDYDSSVLPRLAEIIRGIKT